MRSSRRRHGAGASAKPKAGTPDLLVTTLAGHCRPCVRPVLGSTTEVTVDSRQGSVAVGAHAHGRDFAAELALAASGVVPRLAVFVQGNGQAYLRPVAGSVARLLRNPVPAVWRRED